MFCFDFFLNPLLEELEDLGVMQGNGMRFRVNERKKGNYTKSVVFIKLKQKRQINRKGRAVDTLNLKQ